mmetsp:Transcript_47241/g.125467  ORF Transcript_47241/g.125467 Transcript_47241/m.125467 type:complete len:239 (-) Transcript_47241:67-783(-)
MDVGPANDGAPKLLGRTRWEAPLVSPGGDYDGKRFPAPHKEEHNVWAFPGRIEEGSTKLSHVPSRGSLSSSSQPTCTSRSSDRWRPRDTGPPRTTSPRPRMSDVLHGDYLSQTPGQRLHSPQRTYCGPSVLVQRARGTSRCTSPCKSPRGLAGDGSPRQSLKASNECLNHLRWLQSDMNVEDTVDEILAKQVNSQREVSLDLELDVSFARSNLRNPTYRNATKSATSLARRSKLTTWR